MDNILKEYEDFMQTSKFYPQDQLPITYPVLGLNGEAGEVAEKVKKCWRDNNGIFGGQIKKDILKELADVLWYIWATADDMGYTLEDVLKIGIEKVKNRKETNTVHGSGDDRELMNKISTLPKNESVIKNDILALKINDCNETFFNLNIRQEQKIRIELLNNILQTTKEYICIFKGIGRIDGSLLLEFDDRSKLDEITVKLNKPIEYSCYICGIRYNNITYRIINYVED